MTFIASTFLFATFIFLFRLSLCFPALRPHWKWHNARNYYRLFKIEFDSLAIGDLHTMHAGKIGCSCSDGPLQPLPARHTILVDTQEAHFRAHPHSSSSSPHLQSLAIWSWGVSLLLNLFYGPSHILVVIPIGDSYSIDYFFTYFIGAGLCCHVRISVGVRGHRRISKEVPSRALYILRVPTKHMWQWAVLWMTRPLYPHPS